MKNLFSKTFFKGVKVLTTALLLSQSLAIYADDRPIFRDPIRFDPRLPRPDLRCLIDPAATEVSFQLGARTATYRAPVRIVGTIRNLGRLAFTSRPAQQAVLLYEDSRIVARREFTSLAPGASLSFAYHRNWDASSPAEGEFPPTYKVVISYDPDIYIDGNAANDDCTQRNNQLSRSGQDINELF